MISKIVESLDVIYQKKTFVKKVINRSPEGKPVSAFYFLMKGDQPLHCPFQPKAIMPNKFDSNKIEIRSFVVCSDSECACFEVIKHKEGEKAILHCQNHRQVEVVQEVE